MDLHPEEITEDIEDRLALTGHLKKLRHLASWGEWREVVEICRKWPLIVGEKIFGNEETILHVAVADDQPKVLRQLVEEIVTDIKILETADEKGNTPLHQAAAMGKTDMAKDLIKKNRELIKACNKDKETPIFVAAMCGKKETFLYLLSECRSGEGIEYWRGRDGNSILHAAILGEHFDLAFQILKSREKAFIHFMNERGQSPVHLLGNTPSAFKSGSHLNRFEKIVYSCVVIEKLKESFFNEDHSQETQTKPHELPANYVVCMALIEGIKRTFKSMMRRGRGVGKNTTEERSQELRLPFPPIYATLYNALELILVLFLQVTGFGFIRAQKFIERKQKHTWAVQVLDELLSQAGTWDYSGGIGPVGFDSLAERHPVDPEIKPTESPMLVAAKTGVKEMVEKILLAFPMAIRDVNQDGKNVVLLAVENRQPSVFKLLNRKQFVGKVSAFQQVDSDGNSVFHLAATCKPWLIPGAALQMQSEIQWYQFIKKSLPTQAIRRLNKKGQTDKAVFIETHKDMVKEGGVWLNNTSNSCSVVAALIASVAFATVAAIPGGDKHEAGKQTFEDKSALEIFSIASLIALCFSVASLVTFLAILTSGYEEAGFYARLTAKLIFGLTSLFISMVSMLISFFASLSFVFKSQLNIQVFTVYAIAILPIAFSAVALFPLYEYLIRSAFGKRPPRTYLRETSLISSIE